MLRSWDRVAKVMVSPFRHPDTGMFWFRRAVPKALRLPVGEVLGRPGKPCWELKWTLGTHELCRAKELMPAAMAKADAILEAARNGARPLSNRETHALAGLWYQRQLNAWEADPSAIDHWDNWDLAMPTDPYIEGTEDSEHPVERQGFAREWKQFLVAFLIQADELLAREGVITDSASSMKLAELLVTRLQDALDVHHRSRRGDFRPDPLPSTFPAWEGRHPEATAKTSASEPAVPLSSLYHGWKLVAVVKPRTVSETDYAVRDLTAFMGHDDAAKITRDDLTRWRKAMKDEGRSNNTWNNRLSLVRQVFAHGVSEEDPEGRSDHRPSSPQGAPEVSSAILRRGRRAHPGGRTQGDAPLASVGTLGHGLLRDASRRSSPATWQRRSAGWRDLAHRRERGR